MKWILSKTCETLLTKQKKYFLRLECQCFRAFSIIFAYPSVQFVQWCTSWINANLDLKNLSKTAPQEVHQPVAFEINGHSSTYCKQWLLELQAFGTNRFSSCNNGVDVQMQRLESLVCVEQNRVLDGCPPLDLHIFDFLQARASMQLGKSVAFDGSPMEVFRSFP